MKSFTTKRFRETYAVLPEHIKQLTLKNYKIWLTDPSHPSLHYKQVHTIKPIYSARVGISYRVLGVQRDEAMIWFWIGSHSDYDKLLKQI
ncbi:MAG: hypothetical protein U0U67_08885 [Chitinophagales bacterium]